MATVLLVALVATLRSGLLLPLAAVSAAVVDLLTADLAVALVAHTGVNRKGSLVNQLSAHRRTERTSRHTAQTAESHTHTVRLVTQCRPVVVAAAAQLQLVATPLNQAPIVQAVLAEMVEKDSQTTGALVRTLCTDQAVAVKHAQCKALVAPMAEQRVALTLQVALVSMQSTKQALVVAVDTAKVAAAQATAAQELSSFVISSTRLRPTVLLPRSAALQQMVKRSLVRVAHGAATPHLLTRINGSEHLLLQVVTRTFQMPRH